MKAHPEAMKPGRPNLAEAVDGATGGGCRAEPVENLT
jgi:hypothetical protein